MEENEGGSSQDTIEAGFSRRKLPLGAPGFAFLLLLILWLLIRIIPAASLVFPSEGEAVLLGNDPWFHLHQAKASVDNFPQIHRWDIASFYPEGSYASAAGLFNLLISGISILIDGGTVADNTIAAVLAWSPVMLGALSLWALYGLGKSLACPFLGVIAVSVRLLFPGTEIERTLLGFGDYHAAELLLATLSIYLFYRLSQSSEQVHWKRWGKAAFSALPLALFPFVWYGAFLHVGAILAVFWIVFLWASLRAGKPNLVMTRLLPYFVALVALIAVVGLLFPDWVMSARNHRFTIAMLVGHCCVLGGLQILMPTVLSKWGARGTRWWIAGTVAAIAVAPFALSSRVRGLLGQLFEKRSEFVSEHYEIDGELLLQNYGLTFLFLPLGVYYLLQKSKSEPGTLLVVFYILLWVFVWAVSRDFGYLIYGIAPLLIAAGIFACFQSASGVMARRKKLFRTFASAVMAISVLLIWPLGITHLPVLAKSDAEGLLSATAPWRDAMDWVKRKTPEPPLPATYSSTGWNRRKGFSYPDGSYGILSHWQYGNLIPALGDRYAVSARARSGRFIQWFLTQTEGDSRDVLARLDETRYVILDAVSVADSFPGEILQEGRDFEDVQVADGKLLSELGDIPLLSYGEEFRGSIGALLYLGDGQGMSTYRLVYESPQPSFLRYRMLVDLDAVELRSTLITDDEMLQEAIPLTKLGASWIEGECFCYSGDLIPTIKIFECVEGAVISGKAPGSSPVDLELDLFCPMTERSFVYRQQIEADQNGMVRFAVPYATEASTDEMVKATGPYRILQEGKLLAEIPVSENAVRKGLETRF